MFRYQVYDLSPSNRTYETTLSSLSSCSRISAFVKCVEWVPHHPWRMTHLKDYEHLMCKMNRSPVWLISFFMYSSTLIPGLPIPRPFWYPEGPEFSPRCLSNAQDRGFFSHYADLFQPLRSPPLWHAAPWVASGQGRRWRRPRWRGRRSRGRRQSSPVAKAARLSGSFSNNRIQWISVRKTVCYQEWRDCSSCFILTASAHWAGWSMFILCFCKVSFQKHPNVHTLFKHVWAVS